jgi:hypothetical protein
MFIPSVFMPHGEDCAITNHVEHAISQRPQEMVVVMEIIRQELSDEYVNDSQ